MGNILAFVLHVLRYEGNRQELKCIAIITFDAVCVGDCACELHWSSVRGRPWCCWHPAEPVLRRPPFSSPLASPRSSPIKSSAIAQRRGMGLYAVDGQLGILFLAITRHHDTLQSRVQSSLYYLLLVSFPSSSCRFSFKMEANWNVRLFRLSSRPSDNHHNSPSHWKLDENNSDENSNRTRTQRHYLLNL